MLALVAGLSGCAGSPTHTTDFNAAQFAQLRFLEGRYSGVGPDGKTFHDEYVFTSPSRLQFYRHADASFAAPTDGSTVELKGDEIVSTWGVFSWKAVALSPARACFDPVSAPSAFCWERVDAQTITVTQRWTDAEGKPQSYVITLRRL